MTVLEIIQKSAEFLAKKGIESARLQSELIIAHVLELPRLQLYLNFDKQVSEKDVDKIREMIIKRGKRIPLQHIIGYTEFCGIKIKTDNRALIPRPETELLTEIAFDCIKETRTPEILDFGTGSGCISIALAMKKTDAKIIAVDISAEAIEIAVDNARMNNVVDRIEFVISDGLANISVNSKFDLIVSNPPYIPSREIVSLQPEVRDHDPIISLDGGEDGLKFYRYLSENASLFLKENGLIVLEIGAGQAESVANILTEKDWEVKKIEKDYNKIERIIVAMPDKNRKIL